MDKAINQKMMRLINRIIQFITDWCGQITEMALIDVLMPLALRISENTINIMLPVMDPGIPRKSQHSRPLELVSAQRK